jgi:hypothetical protein
MDLVIAFALFTANMSAGGSPPVPPLYRSSSAAASRAESGEVSSSAVLVNDERPGATSAQGWNALGPDNLGGRTLALLIDPRNPANMYAGT